MDKEKKYDNPQDEPQKVSEAAVSYQTDVNAVRERIMENIMYIENPEKLKMLEDFVDELCMPPGKPPCQYTLEELRERLIQGEKDIKEGRVYDAYEVMKDWDKWADD